MGSERIAELESELALVKEVPREASYSDQPNAIAVLEAELERKEEETSARIVEWQLARLSEAFSLFDFDQSGEMCEEEFFAIGSALHGGDWDTTRNHAAFMELNRDGEGHVHRDEFLSFYEDMLGDLSDHDFNVGMDKFMEAARGRYAQKLRQSEEQCSSLKARLAAFATDGGGDVAMGQPSEGQELPQTSLHPAEGALALYKAHAVGQQAMGLDKLGAAGDVYVCMLHWRHGAGIQPRPSLAYRCLRYMMWLTEALIIVTVMFYVYAWRQKRLQRQFS